MRQKKHFNARARVANDLPDIYLNPNSPLHCGECKQRLGVLHVLRYALFKDQGTHYFVPCKRCGHVNERVKGALKHDIDERWSTLEKEMNEEEQAKKDAPRE